MSTIMTRQLWWEVNAPRWAKRALIGVILLSSAYLGYRGTVPLLELSVLGAVVGVLSIVRWPPLGVTAIVASTLAFPFTIGTGTNTSLHASVLLIAGLTIVWVLEVALRHRAEVVLSLPILPLAAFVAVALLAFFSGLQPWLFYAPTAAVPVQIGGLAIFLLSACAFLLVAYRLPALRWLQIITWVYLALGALHISTYFVPGAGILSSALLGRTTLGSLFWTWLPALAFSQAVFNQTLGTTWRSALGVLIGASSYIALVLHRDWTSGWLPAIVAMVVALGFGRPRLIPHLTLAGLVVAATRLPQLHEFVMGGDNEYSLMTRLEAWRILAEIVSLNPFLGLGFANYYWYTPYFPILGYTVSFNSHNNYVDIVAQTGLIGLAMFGWFIGALAILAWRLRAQLPPGGFAHAYVCGALGGLAGMVVAAMLGDWVLPFVYNVGFAGFRYSVAGWMFLGGLVLLDRSTPGPPADEADEAVREVHEARDAQ